MSARLLRLAGPVTGVVVLALVVGWFPARQSTRSAEDRTESAARLVDELSWEIEDLAVLEPDEAALREEQDRLVAAVPADHELPAVILTLQGLADATDHELLDVVPTAILGSFDDPDTPPGTSSIVVSVALRGDYAGLIDLLDRIAADPRLMVVDGVAIGVDELTGRLAIDLEIRVFTTRELVIVDDGFFEDFGLDEDGGALPDEEVG